MSSGIPRGFLTERKGEVIPYGGTEDDWKRRGNQQWKAWYWRGIWRMRVSAESRGGCVKLKTVTEIRQEPQKSTVDEKYWIIFMFETPPPPPPPPPPPTLTSCHIHCLKTCSRKPFGLKSNLQISTKATHSCICYRYAKHHFSKS